MDKVKFENSIQLLRDFSEKLNDAFNSDIEFVKLLNSISQPGRNSLLAVYENATGPVKEIRKKVAEILIARDIQIGELQIIIDQSVAANPQSFKSMYKNWYNMLYMFLIQDFRIEMNSAIEFICTSVIDDLDGENKIIAKKFDFTGERETGSTRCWIAIINKTHPSQSTAKQLFIDIHNGEIEYCLYDWPNRNKIDKTILSKGQRFKYEDFIAIFKKHLPAIISDDSKTGLNFWRIGTSDGKNSYWDEMHSNNKICIGWSDIGNLKDAKVKNRKDIINLLTNEGIYKDDNRTKSRKAGEILSFYKESQIGDIVLAQEGATILGIGQIQNDYSFNESVDFSHEKEVKWLIENPNLINNEGLRTTFVSLSDEDLITKIKELLNLNTLDVQNETNEKMSAHLNQILFGPPGTGKTFSTVNRAIQIINPDFNLEQDRQIVKAEFDRLLQDGQTEFTTFHQSMSYEDFIEGIKPIEPKAEGQPVIYKTIDGIFKALCDRIRNIEKLTASSQSTATLVSGFDDVYDAFIKRLKEIISELEENEHHTFESRRSRVKLLKIVDDNSILTTGEAANSNETVTKDKLKRIYDKFKNPNEITNLVKQFREVGTDIGWTTNYFAVFKALKEFESSIAINSNDSVKKKQNFVLVIDEINRGNVSQIFGELITLIEQDKRIGQDEALEITLPYSKQKFGVPDNLYIIGTMNTADRSVEALDTALRRRFSFEEMPPKYKLPELEYKVYGYAASDILKTINHRIEKLLDRDHAIGHSYFINKDEETIVESFYKCIIPLLQEYFFGDYGKIGLVLGKGFIIKKEWDKLSYSFADFDYEGSGDFDEKEVFRIIDYRSDETTTVLIDNQEVSMDFGRAIQLLMKGSILG